MDTGKSEKEFRTVLFQHATGSLSTREAIKCLKSVANDSKKGEATNTHANYRTNLHQMAFVLIETEYDSGGSYDYAICCGFDECHIRSERQRRQKAAVKNGNHHIEYRVERVQYLQEN